MFNTKIFSLICLLFFTFLSSCVGVEVPSSEASEESVEISQSIEASKESEGSEEAENSEESEVFISDFSEESYETAISLPFIPFD